MRRRRAMPPCVSRSPRPSCAPRSATSPLRRPADLVNNADPLARQAPRRATLQQRHPGGLHGFPRHVRNREADADRLRSQGHRRHRRLHRGPLADRRVVEPDHARARAPEGRADRDPLHRFDRHRRAQHHPGRRDPRLLRRRDHVVRRAGGRPRHRGRRGLGRAAVQFRRRRVHPRAAPVQGRRLRGRGRRRGHGPHDRPLQHDDRRARQRADDGRQREDHEQHDQELQPQPVSAGRAHRAARPQRRSG